MRLAVIGDHRFGEDLLQLVTHSVEVNWPRRTRLLRACLRKLEKNPLRRPAAKRHQPGAFEPFAADEQARTEVQAARHPVRLARHRPHNPELRHAQLHHRARLHVEPDRHIIRDGDALRVQSFFQRPVRIERDAPVEGIDCRVDRFHRDERGHAVRLPAAQHRHGLRDACDARAAPHVAVDALLLFGRQFGELPDAHVGGHQGASLPPQLFLKGIREPAHARECAYARRHAEHGKQELWRRGASLAPGDAPGEFPAREESHAAFFSSLSIRPSRIVRIRVAHPASS